MSRLLQLALCLLAFAIAPALAHAQTIAEMAKADQEDRAAASAEEIGWVEVSKRDAQRRERVKQLDRQGRLATAADYYGAASIMQHGNETRDYLYANELASRALRLDPKYPGAAFLKAASWDRALRSRGKKQWYGTQFTMKDGQKLYRPVEPGKVSDAERLQLGLPPLAEMQPQAPGTH